MTKKNEGTIILGIDPGYGTVGYGLIAICGNRFVHVAHGAIRTTSNQPLPLRLSEIYDAITRILDEYRPTEAAVESLFFFRNVTTALAVSEARGVIQLNLYQHSVLSHEYTPFQVKQAVSGNGRAEKGQVQRIVKTLLHMDKNPTPDDAADALAIAICHANSRDSLNHIQGRVQ
jgi:crossover junction endodeoxyribonuclease RuvC